MGESAIVTILLDQVGLHTEAAQGYQVNWDLQDADGCWAYTPGWEHYMWAASGSVPAGASLNRAGSAMEWKNVKGTVKFEVRVE